MRDLEDATRIALRRYYSRRATPLTCVGVVSGEVQEFDMKAGRWITVMLGDVRVKDNRRIR